MGTDSLVNRANGQVIDQDFFNLFNRVFQGDFVGRNSAGAAESGKNLGTVTIPWGTARITNLILNGLAVDTGSLTAPPNRVVSGAIRATSEFPDYLRPAGSGNGNDFDVLATATNLSLDINGVDVAFSADVNKASLTVAPSSNNTCLVNDTGLTGQDYTKNLGEDETTIPVDTMGSELTSKVGEWVALLNQTSGEIMYCLVESTTLLSNARRGFFFNSSGTPIPRDVLNNNEVLQILSLAFIFADANGSTIDVSYRNPVVGATTPGSPQTGDYWLDTAVNEWKRYSGTGFVSIDRTFIGYAVLDTADCIGTRPEYFSKSYSDENSCNLVLQSTDIVQTIQSDFSISVDGAVKKFDFAFTTWNASTDFESGVSRTASTQYYLYITEDGDTKISDKKSFDTFYFLLGLYHPFESWRLVGEVYNNSSNEFETVVTLGDGQHVKYEYAHVWDEKTAGTSGGASSTSYVTRVLNQYETNIPGFSLASNIITLPPGIYLFDADTTNVIHSSKSKLVRDPSGVATTEIVGTSLYNDNASNIVVRGKVRGVIFVSEPTEFEIQQRNSGVNANGFGTGVNLGEPEIYTDALITKIG